MKQTKADYERDGYYIVPEQVVPDDIMQNALKEMVAVRDGVFDLDLPPNPASRLRPKCSLQDQQSPQI